jgi:hypothetical protein
MWYLLVVVVALVGNHYTRATTRDEFELLKNDMQSDTVLLSSFESLISTQTKLFAEIEEFERVRTSSIPSNSGDAAFYDEETHDPWAEDRDFRHLQKAQVHTDVVFVGFPASAVEYIQKSWLESLTHECNTTGVYQGKRFDMPGGMSVRHHYHLLQVSFHVADLLRDKLTDMMADTLDEDKKEGFPINAWEIEDLLGGLTRALGASGPAFREQGNYHTYVPSNTIYVLNIDDLDDALKLRGVTGSNNQRVKYWYRNGFTEAQLDRLALDDALVSRSKQVLISQSNSVRETISNSDHNSPSLTDRHAVDIVSEMLSFWSWPRENNFDDYGYGYSDHYRKVTQQIHSRQAVAESRAWAIEYTEKGSSSGASGDTTMMPTLEQRALRLLEAPLQMEDRHRTGAGVDHRRYTLARAILRHASEAELGKKQQHRHANGNAADRDASCGAGTWVGSSNFLWIDEQSADHSPHAASRYHTSNSGGTKPARELRELLPSKKLSASEWQTLGDSQMNIKRDVERGLTRLQLIALDHYSSALSLADQVKGCPAYVLAEFPVASLVLTGSADPPQESHNVYGELSSYHNAGTISLPCVVLLQQATLLRSAFVTTKKQWGQIKEVKGRNSVSSSDMSEEELQSLDDAALVAREENLVRLQRFTEILFDSLKEVIASSGALSHELETTRHTGVVSEAASLYLGHVLAKVVSMSEQITAASLGLHLSPYTPGLPLPGDVSLIEDDHHALGGPGNLARGRGGRLAIGSAAERAREVSIPERGLADFISTRVGATSSSSSTPYTEELLLPRTLPPMSFPQRIDVVVYLVRLQSLYEPLHSDPTDTKMAFDYRQVVRGLAALTLPNQVLTTTLRTIDVHSSSGSNGGRDEGTEHNDIVIGVKACTRQRSGSDGGSYIDADCLWAYLRRYDSTDSNKQQQQQQQQGYRAWETATQHVPVFVLSMDSRNGPVFANADLASATVMAEGVLAVQNSQSKIATGKYCTAREVYRNGRDPSGAVLVAAGLIIAGINPNNGGLTSVHTSPADAFLGGNARASSSSSSSSTRGQMARDLALDGIFGSSTSYHTTAEAELGAASFSSLEVMAAHRARVLRLVGHSHQLLGRSVVAAPTGTVLRKQAVIVRAFFVALLGKLVHEAEIVESWREMETVAAQTNAVYFLIEDWLVDKSLPSTIFDVVSERMGGLPRNELEIESGGGGWWGGHYATTGRNNGGAHRNTGPSSPSEGLLSAIGFWPIALFCLSFAASAFWPKKKKPARYL